MLALATAQQVADVMEGYVRDWVSLRIFSNSMRALREKEARHWIRVFSDSVGSIEQGTLRGKSFRLKVRPQSAERKRTHRFPLSPHFIQNITSLSFP